MTSKLYTGILSFIKYVKLPYLDKNQNKDFSYHYNKEAISIFKFTLFIIVIIAFPYFAFDYYSSPQTYKTKWILRFFMVVLPSVIGFIFVKKNKFFITNFQYISTFINLLINIAVILLLYTSTIQEYSFNHYYVGITLIMTAAIAMRIRVVYMIFNYTITIVSYFIVAKFIQNLTQLDLYSNMFFLITIALSLIIGNYLIEIYTRKTFIQQLLINRQKNVLSENNEELKQLIEEITTQRDELNKTKKQLEIKHEEVNQSINYATKLQEAILPTDDLLNKYFSDYFILYKPKDKVSGDFYWWANVNNKTIVAAVDCTGHGVPGAFMSMLGSSMLRDIVEKELITDTSEILSVLRKEIIHSLKQKGELGEQNDGMDMAIISVDHETNTLQFSGANNPLYVITNDKRNLTDFDNLLGLEGFYEIKPDKMPISIYSKMKTFSSYKFKLSKGDILYMFSDGYADQFGGKKGKRLKTKALKELLITNKDKTMTQQKELLDSYHNEWKGNFEQIDDILIIGIKI